MHISRINSMNEEEGCVFTLAKYLTIIILDIQQAICGHLYLSATSLSNIPP